jgi:hypothetical protein
VRITYLPDAEQSPLWPEILALLERGASLSGCEPKEPEDTVWAAIEDETIFAAFTLRLTDEALEIRAAGGTRLKDWVQLLDDAATEIARLEGRKLHCRGRKGWAWFAKRLGWKFVGRDEAGLPMFEKEV